MHPFSFIFSIFFFLLVCSFVSSYASFPGSRSCPFHKSSSSTLQDPLDDVAVLQQLASKYYKSKNSSSSNDPLQEMNLLLQSEYASTKYEILAETVAQKPLIIAQGDYMLFWNKETTVNESMIPSLYTNLKYICHVGLATYVFMEGPISTSGGNVNNETVARVQEYLQLFPAAYASLPSRGFSQDQMDRANQILKSSEKALNSMIQTLYVDESILNHYARPLTLLISKNIFDAAYAQLTTMHKQVMNWKKTLTEDEWNELYVVLLGSHMARHGELALQYFSNLLDTPALSGERVIYAEGLDIHGGLDLLATHLIDFSAGKAFWNDPEHMHFDVLAHATKRILPWLLGNSTNFE